MAGPTTAGLCRRSGRRLAVRCRRTGAAPDPLGPGAVRRPGQRQRRVALSAPTAIAVALSSPQRTAARTVALAQAAAGNAAAVVAPSRLCRCVHLGPPGRRSAPGRARPTWPRSGRTPTGGLCRVSAGQAPGLPVLGAIPEQCPPTKATAPTWPDPRTGADDGVAVGRVGRVRSMRLPDADALHARAALRMSAAAFGLRGAGVSELRWRLPRAVGARTGVAGGDTGQSGMEPACRPGMRA